MDGKDALADRVWQSFRGVCNALRSSKGVKDRLAAMTNAELFMADPRHRAYVRKWRGWGLLFSGLIHAVRADVCAYLCVDPATGSVVTAKKRKLKAAAASTTKARLPKLAWWLNLRNELSNAHALDGPILHLDPNGRDCVTELFDFALLVINRGDDSDPDPNARRVMGDLERAAWQTIEHLVGFRVYCAVLEKRQLQEAIELALAAVDHSAVSHSSFPSSGSTDCALLASCIHLVLNHAPYDLHDWLPMLVPFVSSWFGTLNEKAENSRLPRAEIAPKMVEIMTDVGRAFFTFVGPLLLKHGNPLLQYIKRSFKRARQGPRVQFAAFVSLYVELFEYHADSLDLHGDLDPRRLRRDAKALQSLLFDPTILRDIPVSSHSSAATASSAATSNSAGSEGVTIALDPAAVTLIVCTADVVYFHDRLLQRVVEAKGQLPPGEEDADMMGSPSPAKRSLESTMPMAWEQLINQIISCESSEESQASNNSNTPLSQLRDQYALQAQHHKQARLLQRRTVTHLLILSAVLRRHGNFYADERIGDLVTLMDHITQTLDSKEIDKRHSLALHLLYELAMLSRTHPDLRSELFEDFWQKTWQTLLRQDLPYSSDLQVVIPRDGVSELAFIVLHCCVSFRLVPRALIANAGSQLWSIYQPRSSSPSAHTFNSSRISIAPICFLTSLFQHLQPPSDSDCQQDGFVPHRDAPMRNARSMVLMAIFEHIQSSLLQEENKPMDATWASFFSVQGVAPAVYAAALLNFVGVSPSAQHGGTLLCSELEPPLLQAFANPVIAESTNIVGPELDGFGVHFALQEWGMAWLESTTPFMKNGNSHNPDRFAPLIEFIREVADVKNLHPASKSDSEKAVGFSRLVIPDKLARRMTMESKYDPAEIARLVGDAADRDSEVSVTTSLSSVEVTKCEIVGKLTQILDDLSNKLSAIEVDSPRQLCLLNSLITVCLTLGCAYGQAKDAPSLNSRSDLTELLGVFCVLLQKYLTVLASHLSAGTVDHARKSPMASCIMTQQLVDFHSLILVIQGGVSLQHMKHPCADPLDLRIPSELRSPIRKIVAAIEASLELILMDDASGGPSQTNSNVHSLGTQPREDRTVSSRSLTAISSTSSVGASWDWDSHVTQSRSAAVAVTSVEEDDDLMSDGAAVTMSKPTYRTTHAPNILSLWSLRLILLLKKESGLKAVRKYGLELGFTPDFLAALASLLCGVSGCESLEVIVKILEAVDEEVSRGIRRGGGGNTVTGVILDSDLLCVLRRSAVMHENRKLLHKEDVPELLLTTARRLIDTGRKQTAREELTVARRAEAAAMEAFFRLDADMFGDFIDVSMSRLLDPVMVVRFESAQALQTLFYMYPDGGDQVFRDLFRVLSHCLPSSAVSPRNAHSDRSEGSGIVQGPNTIETCVVAMVTLYVCACSSPTVVPEALLVFMRLATTDEVQVYSRSTILRDWLSEIAIHHNYPSIGRMVADHFFFLWSHHMATISSGVSLIEAEDRRNQTVHSERVGGKAVLDAFPATLLFDKMDGCSSPTSARRFSDHADVILPSAVLYDVVHGADKAGVQDFHLVKDLARHLFSKPNSGDNEENTQHQVSSFVEEQLITDLFALAFVLESSSGVINGTSAEGMGAHMLTLAEDRASTYALTISHLGHVVVKMARFSVWDVVGCTNCSGFEASAVSDGGGQWLQAMKLMKEKYSGFDWARMNLAELLSEFHEFLLRTTYFEPLASRAIECLCLFVAEIKDAISDPSIANAAVLQQLLLHVLFETVKNVTRRDKQSSRKLALLVRDICDHLMNSCTEVFGKYLNFVVQQIADILVRASRHSDSFSLDSDDKVHYEWVIYAICTNMAAGLGKYMVDVEVVPGGVSASLDKVNRMLSTSSGAMPKASSTERRKSLEHANKKRPASTIGNKSCQQAVVAIEQFVQRANQVGERFYHPRTIAIADAFEVGQRERSSADAAGVGSQLQLLREHVRVLQGELQASAREEMIDEEKEEAETVQKAVLAKLTRTLLTLSTQFDNGSASIGTNGTENGTTLADILGEIGLWDTHDFELSCGQDEQELSRLYQRHFRRGALRETKSTFQIEMYEHMLRYLSSLLFESSSDPRTNSDVIHQALSSIKKVLRLDEGIKALSKCKDQELKIFLEAFVQTSPSNWSLVFTPAHGVSSPTIARLSSLRALWRAHSSSPFDDWISRLTEAMAERCVDRVLQACAPLARLRRDFAIFMFPYALWAILKNSSRDSKTAAVVNESIREILSSTAPATLPDGRVVQLVIHSVNFLRETEKSLFVESNGQRAGATPTKRSTSSNTSSSTTAPSLIADANKRGATEDKSPVKLAYSCLVDVDLLELAAAAIRVKMPFSAMQFVEMWLEGRHQGSLPSLSAPSLPPSGAVEWDARVRAILVDAYSQDDDVDGIYGVNDGRTFESQMVTYNREGNFVQVLPLYDVALQFDRSASSMHVLEGSLNALSSLGYENMLLQRLEALAGSGMNTSNIQEHRYELAWKSLQWDSLDVSASSVPEAPSSPYMHQRTLYQSLKALAHRDSVQLKVTTATAKQHILKTVRVSLFGLESTQESLKALLQLQSLNEIEECATLLENGDTTALRRLFASWHQRHLVQSKNVFDATHSLLALEEVLSQVIDLPERVNTLASIYLSVSTMSRQAGRVAVTYKAHMKLEELHSKSLLRVHDEAQWKMERAKLLWSQKETRSAIWVAKRLQSELEEKIQSGQADADTHLRILHVASLTMIGKWIASQRSENSQVILQDYLQKATDIVDSMNGSEIHATPSDAQLAAKAHVALAEYMAEMYQQVAARVSSREWLAGKRVAEARQKELAECLAMNEAKQHDNRAHIHALNKEVQYDYEERTKVEASVDQFLGGALRSFGKALAFSAKSELSVVFRVLSLWFSNQLKPGVNRVVREIVETVPSYKFVPLSYQIISRVGSSLSGASSSRSDSDGAALFERVLSAMIIKLCEQHPHHALVQLIALKNSGDVEGKGAVEFRTNVGDAKSEGAKKYVEKLRKGPQKELLESLDVLSNAYIQLALFDTRDYHKLGKKIPLADVKITTLGGNAIPFDQCLRERSRRSGGASGSSRAAMPAVLTSSIAPRPDMDYSGVSRMLSFDPMFSITDSGIHRPKIIYCFGSDGGRFKQLVKGKDDIRQDLVIEQVFDTVNQFLKDDQSTRKRNLRLRTYKVVPLSPIAGVLEWVDNTIPWGSYLVSRAGKRLSAHERYHPHEWKHTDCRMYLKNQPDKYAAYQTIQANFTPVFHHFFLEKFPDPAMWYKRRLAYVQSAAVTSIVGYILGIGDRHSQNILIHEETAELVHIDFGVVFDQGMALFTPETVPFRLTRDLVDGMGVSGVEGVFTRCCEATLQLLRKKSASVVTILEVFVHDPLYRWTLSPLKALKIQEEGGTAAVSNTTGSETDDNSNAGGVAGANNDAAARALIRVKQKLEGYEDPNGNALSIEGQVKQLISAAQDPRNLCALFPGWAPWL